jgi:hypothetical protein
MFLTLRSTATDIMNTHVLFGNTTHPAVKKKIPMKKVKVHQVHEYTYSALSQGKRQRVELAYHGGICTPNFSTTETFVTTDDTYVKWLTAAVFEAYHWEMEGLHVCRPKKPVFHGAKAGTQKVSKNKKEHAQVSAFQQDIIEFAHEWASQDYTKDSDIETTYLKQPEQSETLKIVIELLGWARKKQPPSVTIPPAIKHELVKLYNVRPNLSTAQSRVKLIALPEYNNSIYVEYFITEARIHSYFAQLQQMKKILKLDASTPLV